MNPENKNPPSDTARWLGGWRMLCLFFLFPSVVYAGFITEFSFYDLEPGAYWQVYNQYFLSLLDGRLDVPVWAIGKEGQFWGDKVYSYYGIAPIITRVLAYPFVDLETISLSRISIWLFLVSGNSILQWSLLKYFSCKAAIDLSSQPFKQLILFSLIIWFGSASTIIIQNSSLYHEPYAASLFLLAIFVAVFANDILWADGPRRYRLAVYALLAAICIHARIPTAIGMLLATAALVIVAAYEGAVDERLGSESGKNLNENLIKFCLLFVRKGFLPGLIVGASFALLFWMNETRFGDWSHMGGPLTYGFFLDGEGYSIRVCASLEHGAFNINRIIPNALYYLFGSLVPHSEMIEAVGMVFVRAEKPPAFLILGWAVPLALFCIFWVQCWRNCKWNGKLATVVCVGALSIGAVTQLSYGTITYRYAADLWAPILLTTFWGVGYVSNFVFAAPDRRAVYIVRAIIVVALSFEFFAVTDYLGYQNAFFGRNDVAKTWPTSTDPQDQGDRKQCEKYFK